MNLLVTLTLSPTSTRLFGLHKCSIRRASGLVQTGFQVTCSALAPSGGEVTEKPDLRAPTLQT